MGIIDFIKTQVKSHGLTLSQLSKKTDIDPAYLSRILNKHISPSANIIDSLLAAVNISCDRMMEKVDTSVELIGEVQGYDGIFRETTPRKIQVFPEPPIFVVKIKAPPLIKGIDYPNDYLLVFSKKAKVKDEDTVFVAYKEGSKIKKLIRRIHFNGTQAVLRSIVPEVLDIVIPKKNIIEMYRMVRMSRMY